MKEGQILHEKQLYKDLAEDLRKYKSIWLNAYYKIGSQKLTGVAKSIMKAYYNDYDPVRYERTYNLRDHSTIAPFIDRKNKWAGVTFSNEGMSDYYVFSPYYQKYIQRPSGRIWYSMWGEGTHGFSTAIKYTSAPSAYTGQRGKTPYEQQLLIKNRLGPQVQEAATRMARKHNYKAQRFK